MPKNFLFRIDGAKDNDAFFNALRPLMSHVYAGVDIQIGSSGWSPDFIRLSAGESNDFTLTLIELDATESIARTSCRKYLPENSAEIVRAFDKYLDRVITQCRSTAHPHEDEFVRLKTILSKADKIIVTTAGALRSSISFTEELSLIDQPNRIVQMRTPETTPGMTSRILTPNFAEEVLRLTPLQAKILSRAILVLDAVIRKEDHSGATFRGWRQNLVLKRPRFKRMRSGSTYPSIRSLLYETKQSGITLNSDALFSDLARMWSEVSKTDFAPGRARNLITGYFPIVSEVNHKKDNMRSVFETAREYMDSETS